MGTTYTESILDLLSHGSEAVVPSMWPVEVANARVSAERRRHITEAKATHFLARLTGFAITMDSPGMARAFQQVLATARKCSLTAHDAADLEWAMRKGLPLATVGEDLKKAAKAVGVAVAAG